MESTSSLSAESFSRSWLVSYNPTSDASPAPEKRQNSSCSTSFDAADEEEASFIEMDPKLSDSRRFYRVGGKDFSFDFRARESPLILADADELITDGLLLPLTTTAAAADRLFTTETTSTCNYYCSYADDDEPEFKNASPKLIISSFSQKEANYNSSSNEVACTASLRRCKSVTKRIFHKYLEFIAPLCEKLRRRRSASRVSNSSMSSPYDHCSLARAAASSSPATNNSALSGNKYEHFVGVSECSISEAVLHCKRTMKEP